jgi:hypothetical protein
MRTAQICPTCATYINAVCVIYDGPYLANLDVAPLTNLSEIIQQINEVVSTLEPALGYIPENVANKVSTAADITTFGSSVDKYPSVKAIKDYTDALVGSVTLQQVLDYDHSLLNGLNFQGTDAGLTNTGTTDVTGIGTNAAKGNSGEYVVAIGENSGLNNTKNHLYAIGNGAGAQNTGLYVSAISSGAAIQNSGDFVNAIGDGSGAANSGDNVNALGYAAADTNTGNHVNAIGRSAGVNNTFNDVTLLGNTASASADDQLVFVNGAGFNARLSNTNLTANRKFELPNADGTLVLSVNGTAPNSSGDVTISVGLPYKSYVINLGWDGLAWSVTDTYENTLGGSVTLASGAAGRLRLTTSGLFTSGKTVVIPCVISGQATLLGVLDFAFSSFPNDIYVRWNNASGGIATPTSFGTNIPYILEVRVYN